MVLTMSAVAEHKGIEVSRLAVSVTGRTEFVGRRAKTHFVSELDLGEGLDTRQTRILYNSARQCEVHKMLQGEVSFDERWSNVPDREAGE